jgi:hypothetical protein
MVADAEVHNSLTGIGLRGKSGRNRDHGSTRVTDDFAIDWQLQVGCPEAVMANRECIRPSARSTLKFRSMDIHSWSNYRLNHARKSSTSPEIFGSTYVNAPDPVVWISIHTKRCAWIKIHATRSEAHGPIYGHGLTQRIMSTAEL